MVYRGKPSKACQQCRRRKLNCDLRREACGQCIRANLLCSGYRDTEQPRIRDETQTTKQRALSRRMNVVPWILPPSIDDRARSAFFSYYVSGLSRTYDVLEILYKQSPSDGYLGASVDAVSLAFFSFHFQLAKASHMAREKYSHALQLLNNALMAPEAVRTDSTLLAVLLLDLFEKIANNNPRSIDSWMSHVNGALALVKLRNSKQLRNYVGLRLSVRLSTNLIISCVTANAPVPPALFKLRSDIEPFLNKDDPKWRVSGLVAKYANLQGAIQEAVQDNSLSSSEIVIRTEVLDQEFMLLAKTMPLAWIYNTANLEKPSERVFEQYFHTYPDHFITQTWNVLRVMRILLNNIICTHCVEGLEKSSKQPPTSDALEIARNTVDALARDICATAPQYTGHENASPKSKTHSEIQKLQCYTLIFPLYVAGVYVSSTTAIKPWIIKQLQFMSDEIGIRNASVVADILERTDGTSPWSVYAILGCYAFAA